MAKLKVTPSERSKRFAELETAEELQKDIQSMYTEAKKIMNGKPVVMQPVMDSLFYSMKKYVDETKNISQMETYQVQLFWDNMYTHLERIKELQKEK
jgi:hypothetical protein